LVPPILNKTVLLNPYLIKHSVGCSDFQWGLGLLELAAHLKINQPRGVMELRISVRPV